MKTNKGFVHMFLLFLMGVAVLLAVGYVFLRSSNVSTLIDNGGLDVPTVTGTQVQGLDKELETTELSDPSQDFTEVDKDIKTL